MTVKNRDDRQPGVAAHPVEVQGLVKRYGRIPAVDHVDLTVETGGVCGFLGPNGAGKTTTLRMLLGLVRRDSGSIRVFGRDPAGPHPGARRGSRVHRGTAAVLLFEWPPESGASSSV